MRKKMTIEEHRECGPKLYEAKKYFVGLMEILDRAQYDCGTYAAEIIKRIDALRATLDDCFESQCPSDFDPEIYYPK